MAWWLVSIASVDESRRKSPKGRPALAGRGSVCPACDARNDRRKIGGELSVENGAGQSSPEVRRQAGWHWARSAIAFLSSRRMPRLHSGGVRKQQVRCRANGSGHTQRA